MVRNNHSFALAAKMGFFLFLLLALALPSQALAAPYVAHVQGAGKNTVSIVLTTPFGSTSKSATL